MQAIVTVSESPASASKVYWHVVPASEFPNGPSDLAHYVHEQHSWVGISSASFSFLPSVKSSDRSCLPFSQSRLVTTSLYVTLVTQRVL